MFSRSRGRSAKGSKIDAISSDGNKLEVLKVEHRRSSTSFISSFGSKRSGRGTSSVSSSSSTLSLKIERDKVERVRIDQARSLGYGSGDRRSASNWPFTASGKPIFQKRFQIGDHVICPPWLAPSDDADRKRDKNVLQPLNETWDKTSPAELEIAEKEWLGTVTDIYRCGLGTPFWIGAYSSWTNSVVRELARCSRRPRLSSKNIVDHSNDAPTCILGHPPRSFAAVDGHRSDGVIFAAEFDAQRLRLAKSVHGRTQNRESSTSRSLLPHVTFATYSESDQGHN